MADSDLLDIVDNEEKVLYQMTRGEAHEKGVLHRTVIAEVINSRGEKLMVKQSSSQQDAGQYVSPVGGHVHTGESNEEALKREAFEELGLKDFEFKFVGRAIFDRVVLGRKENHYFIVYEIYSDVTPVGNEEVESFKYFSKEGLKKEIKNSPKSFGAAFYFVAKSFYPELLEN